MRLLRVYQMVSLNNYAKALFDLCKTKTEQKVIFDDFDAFSKIVTEDYPLWINYQNCARKQIALTNIDQLPLQSITFKNFLKVLCLDKQLFNLNKIKKHYFKLVDESLNIAYVTVKAATDLSLKLQKELAKKVDDLIPDKKVIMNYKIDKQLISGYKIDYLGMELDKSVVSRLEKIFFGV